MKLLTKAILKSLPPLYSSENKDDSETTIPVKFFNPCGVGTWWAIEYDPKDASFYGIVDLGYGKEFGYFSLKELEECKLSFGLKIERDLHWDKTITVEKVLN